MKFFVFLLLIIQAGSLSAQDLLFKSSAFSISHDGVCQNEHQAIAMSDSEISSGYAGIWKLQKDISHFPSYRSPHRLVDALYNKTLEELVLDIREDGAFMAGEKWTGIWTRDISYSIILSLAIVAPDASKTSLMAKVQSGRIIQDTGTGGAWPVSSDRMVWALAAWEVYAVTGDKKWLKDSYEIIKNSADDDLNTLPDKSTGLFRGESSFLDWREQTYPRWMDPKDIFGSMNLGTNAVHYQTYRILSMMASELKEKEYAFDKTAETIRTGINKYLWMEDKGYYGQYLYGRNYLSLSPKSEALGEALVVLFGIADKARQQRIIESVPVTEFGVPCIYPQIPNIPPYHNNAVWPFVASYWAWAAARTGNTAAVEHAMASVYRPAALFGTNKENFVAATGDFAGTEINSNRQLWSVAGNLAMIYRIIFGMNFGADQLELTPFIPPAYNGNRTLGNIRYRNMTLSINIEGYGSKIKTVEIDGCPSNKAVIPGSLQGVHSVKIIMANEIPSAGKQNLLANRFSPETPALRIENSGLTWANINNARQYIVYLNGKQIATVNKNSYKPSRRQSDLYYQVLAVDENGCQSFLSEPVSFDHNTTLIELEKYYGDIRSDTSGFSGDGYILLDKNTPVHFSANVKQSGTYLLDFRYANGNGPVNTSNKCAIRDIYLNGKKTGVVVLPQRGDMNWKSWGYSNPVSVKLRKGNNKLHIDFSESNNNMNKQVNTAFLDQARLIYISK